MSFLKPPDVIIITLGAGSREQIYINTGLMRKANITPN